VSNDEEKLNQLSAKIDELITAVNKVTEELQSFSASIKLLSVAQNQSQSIATPNSTITPLKSTYTPSALTEEKTTSTPQGEIKMRSLDDVRMSFPEDLEAKLAFEDKENYITVKPKQFLGSDNFAKIASAIRGMGGEYISAGKDSHFRVPKKKPIN